MCQIKLNRLNTNVNINIGKEGGAIHGLCRSIKGLHRVLKDTFCQLFASKD